MMSCGFPTRRRLVVASRSTTILKILSPLASLHFAETLKNTINPLEMHMLA
jgi:hypothetical protein